MLQSVADLTQLMKRNTAVFVVGVLSTQVLDILLNVGDAFCWIDFALSLLVETQCVLASETYGWSSQRLSLPEATINGIAHQQQGDLYKEM